MLRIRTTVLGLVFAFTVSAQMDPSYFREDSVGKHVLRSIGGVLGVSIEDHGALGLDDIRKFSRDGFPTAVDDLSQFYFGYNSVSVGLVLGPRFSLARLVNGQPRDRGWTIHLGLMPRVFFLFYYLDGFEGDSATTTNYLYTVSQMELAVGGGHFWHAQIGRAFYMEGGLLAELGTAGSSTLSLLGVKEYTFSGTTTTETLVDRSFTARGSTYGRVFATLEAGFRIRQRVDLGVHARLGTGLMYLHGVEVRPVLSSTIYALQVQFLIRR